MWLLPRYRFGCPQDTLPMPMLLSFSSAVPNYCKYSHFGQLLFLLKYCKQDKSSLVFHFQKYRIYNPIW